MVEELTCRAPDTAAEPLKSSSGEVRPLRWHWKCLFDNIWRSDLLGGNEWRRTFLPVQRCNFIFNIDFYVWTDTFSFYVFGFCVYAYMNVGPENKLKSHSVGAIHLVLETDSLSSLELALSLVELYLLNANFTDMHHHSQFMWCWTWTQAFIHRREAFY